MKDPRQARRIEMVASLTAAIRTRWSEANLEPCLGDDVRASLAALEFLEAALDKDSPWDLRDVVDLPRDAAQPNESKPA